MLVFVFAGCTPACYRARVGKHPCCADGICIYPGICGCGPSCPEPCGIGFVRCDMLGPNVFWDGYATCYTFPDANTTKPLCCGCGAGYVKKGEAGAPGSTEMER